MGKYVELCNTCQFNMTNGATCMTCLYGDKYSDIYSKDNGGLYNIISELEESLMLVEKESNRARVLKEVFGIEKVIFNIPATVVLWKDGTKTVVKSGDYDVFDPEKGMAMAIAKKALGNNGSYYDIFKEWIPEETERVSRIKASALVSDSRGVYGSAIEIDDINGTLKEKADDIANRIVDKLVRNNPNLISEEELES